MTDQKSLEDIQQAVPDKDVLDLLRITMKDLYKVGARIVTKNTFEIQAGPNKATVSYDEIMALRLSAKDFMMMLKNKIEGEKSE